MRARHITTGVTLVVLLLILAAGAWVGYRSLVAPVPGDGTTSSATPTCSPQSLRRGQRVVSTQVAVSVWNAGTRPGAAGRTLRMLTNRGFTQGEVGNAPSGTKVRRAQIWTTRRHDAAARLVALQFGPGTKVELKRTDLGPGVDVVVGDDFDRLSTAARSVVVRNAQSACLPATSKR